MTKITIDIILESMEYGKLVKILWGTVTLIPFLNSVLFFTEIYEVTIGCDIIQENIYSFITQILIVMKASRGALAMQWWIDRNINLVGLCCVVRWVRSEGMETANEDCFEASNYNRDEEAVVWKEIGNISFEIDLSHQRQRTQKNWKKRAQGLKKERRKDLKNERGVSVK